MVICRAYAHILMPIQQADAAQKKKSGAINLPNCSFFKTLKRRGSMAVWKTPPSLGGVLPKFWVGVCRTVLKTLTLFQTKIYHFHAPFQT